MSGYHNTIALIFQMSVLQYLFFPFIFFRGSFNKMNESTDTLIIILHEKQY